MNRCHSLWLAVVVLFLTACAKTAPPPPPDPAFATLGLHSVAIGPVAYATHQPNEPCSLFIDEEVRSALVRELRLLGYEAITTGNSVPRTFAAGSPPPLPDDPPPTDLVPVADGQGMLQVWIEEYWENTLCGWEGPKYLTIGAVGILYAGSPPREVWRQRGRAAEQGGYAASDLIWLTTTRLSDQLLETFPAGPGWPKQH